MTQPQGKNLSSAAGKMRLDQMLSQGGEMGELIRNLDWSKTPLGAIETWPQSLLTAVSICLFSRFPILIFWGPDLIKIYNDAYRPILGTNKHPRALGRPGQETWSEIWHIIGPMLESVYREGRATWSYDQMLPMDRHGFVEETYFTFSYSPIFDETGGVGGIFTAVTETTERVLSERRLNTLHDLSERSAEGKTAEEACRFAAEELCKNPADVPFALIYLLDETGKQANLTGHANVETDSDLFLPTIDLNGDSAFAEPLRQVLETGQPVLLDDLSMRFRALPVNSPQTAFVLPIAASGHTHTAGFLIVGVSPRLILTDDYRHFYVLVVGHIATAIANARAYEEERRRAEALAELDRAKTEFFSNISHEFRTPLTLMLNPLQETLSSAESLSAEQRENLQTAYRNSLRLQKLVNTLLDFSRIQSNRIRASFEPTELGAYTTDLASNFRSVVERVGLRLIIDCPPLSEPVYVDREMWEKIVLNLLSNAFKFTFEGEITVSLHEVASEAGDTVELNVRDTGIGIAESDLAHIFERFHRVHGARSRTYEGSGIGLALVAELVRFHRGQIAVTSTPGVGTTFTVSIPKGTAHLPPDQVSAPRTLASTALRAVYFTEEARRWLADDERNEHQSILSKYDTSEVIAIASGESSNAKILVVDDNADMRDYLRRLLETQYQVETATDGLNALERIEQNPPDLVVADIMMPNLDGFGLLTKLRSNPETHALPVLFLSARAGEEARIEGLQAGANDYLTKPFSARELMARVDAQLQMAQLRQQTVTTIQTLIEGIADPFYALDEDWCFVYVNRRAQQMWNKTPNELIGNNIWEVFPQGVGTEAYQVMHRVVETQRPIAFETFSSFVNRWVEINVYPTGSGLVVYFRDISSRKQAEAVLQANAERDAFRVALADALRSLSDPIVIQGEASRLLGEYLGVNRVAYSEIIGEDAIIHIDYVDGLTSLKGHYRPADFGESIIKPLQRGETVVVNDTKTYADFNPAERIVYAALNIRSFIGVSLVKDGKWAAVLGVYRVEPTVWTDDEITLTEETAERTWAAVERAKAEGALRESEMRFRNMANNAPVMVWVTEADGSCSFLSDSWYKFTGQTPETGLEFGWLDVVHPDDRPNTERVFWDATSRAEPFRLEYRLRRVDGEYRWTIDSARPRLTEAGEFLGFIGSVIDMTERKQAEEALRKSEERQVFLLKLSDALRPLSDPADIQYQAARVLGEHLRANRVGYAEDQGDGETVVVTHNYTDGVPGIEGRYQYKNYGSQLLSDFQAGRTVVRPDIANDPSLTDEEKQAHAALQLGATVNMPLVKEGKLVALLFVHYRDAHVWSEDELKLIEETAERTWAAVERVHAEAALRETERRLALAQQAGNVGVWDWDAATDASYWSETMWKLYGLDPQPMRLKDEFWNTHIHPGDRARVEAKIAVTLASSESDYWDEFRIIRQDGAIRWIESVGRVTRDAAGKALRMSGVNLDITTRKHFEQALREAEERLRLIIDSAKDFAIFALDIDGRVTAWNSGAERMFGYTETEIIGKPGAVIYTAEDQAYGIPEFEMNKAAQTGYAENERWHLRKNGSRLYASGAMRPILDETGTLIGFTKVARDATDRVLAEARTALLQGLAAELSAQLTPKEMAKSIVRAVPQAVGNAISSVFLLLPEEQMMERLYSEGLPESTEEMYRRVPFTFPSPTIDVGLGGSILELNTQAQHLERYPNLAETIKLIGIHASITLPLKLDGQNLGIITIIFPYPKQLSTQERELLIAIAHLCAQALQRARLYEDEAKARKEAEQANATKLRFLGMISHELRTPLASIKGFASTLLASDVVFSPDEQRQFLHVIDEEADKLSSLVEQLLDLSRLQSGTLRIELRPETLYDILNVARSQLNTLVVRHQLIMDIPSDLPEIIADPQRIAQVLVNLVGNAAKFSPPATRITVKAAVIDHHIQIDVSDQGIGIPLEERDAVFEAFQRVTRRIHDQRLGAGLGLAICKSIVEAHGGRIWIQDQSEGTTISFVLPIAPSK